MTSNLDPAAELFAIRNQIAGSLSRADENGFVTTSGEFLQRITAYLDTLSHDGEGEPVGELRRAQTIIDGLRNFREYCLTKAVNADEIVVMLAEQWPDAEGKEYIAVRIAEAIDGRIQNFPYLATPRPDTAEGERERVLEEAAKAVEREPTLYFDDALGRVNEEVRKAHATACAAAIRALSKPAPQAEGGDRCDDCHGPALVWFAPDELWNEVMGGPEATDDPGGKVCPCCFIIRAEKAGIKPVWSLNPQADGVSEAMRNLERQLLDAFFVPVFAPDVAIKARGIIRDEFAARARPVDKGEGTAE